MKDIKRFGMLLLFVFVIPPAQGQFLKKLKEKVEQRVEQTVTEKIANKAAREAGKTLDNLMEGKMGQNSPFPMGGEMGSIEDVPDTYDFEWAYQLHMETEKQKKGMDITYYLKEDAPYWGARIQQGMSLFMVYDMANKLTVIFMENEGNNFVTANTIPDEMLIDEDEEVSYEDYSFREIEGKEILGYSCKGFEMENHQYKFTMYVTFETEISFSDIYGKSEQIPKGFNVDWLKDGDKEGLVMEMQMENKSKKNESFQMECTRLEREEMTIRKADYGNLGGG